jgi:hypothetical protein
LNVAHPGGHDAPVTAPVIDLFAGPGGWDLAAHHLGMRPLGIEWDPAACATRHAAGLWTLQADVGALNPTQVMRQHFTGEPLDGLIASPPCQAFSMAGKGAGRDAMDIYLAQIRRMAHGHRIERQLLDEYCGDSALTSSSSRCAGRSPSAPGGSPASRSSPSSRSGKPWARRCASTATTPPPGSCPPNATASPKPAGGPSCSRPSTGRSAAGADARPVRAPRNRDDEGGGLFDLPEPDRITLPEDRTLSRG